MHPMPEASLLDKVCPCKMEERKKIFVRSGIRTHALIRGPEISAHPLSGDKAQALSLDKGLVEISGPLMRAWVRIPLLTKTF